MSVLFEIAVRDSMLAIKVIISFLQINFSMPTMMSSFEYPSNYRTFLNRLSFVNVDFLSVIGVSALLVCGFFFAFPGSLLIIHIVLLLFPLTFLTSFA